MTATMPGAGIARGKRSQLAARFSDGMILPCEDVKRGTAAAIATRTVGRAAADHPARTLDPAMEETEANLHFLQRSPVMMPRPRIGNRREKTTQSAAARMAPMFINCLVVLLEYLKGGYPCLAL
jgi:hypothetical protein